MKNKFNDKPITISTEELYSQLDNPNLKLIDVRPADAYNGWKFNDEIRGGHIKNAKSLPFKWLRYLDWMDIVHVKNISKHDTLIVYGYDNAETEDVVKHFIHVGYKDVKVYNDFVSEWSSNPELPMSHLKRYRQLVGAKWLKRLIETDNADEYDNNDYVICHAHYQNPDDYHKGHIQGSVELDTNTLESIQTWNRRSPEEIEKTLTSTGITKDTTVILYGRFSFPDNEDPFPGSSAGQLAAMRCAFIMMYAGVQDVRILNGGLQSWEDEGYSITTSEKVKRPVSAFGAAIPQNPQFAVDLPGAKEILSSDDANLISVRSWQEFIGEVSGYNYIYRKGRIPGAIFGNCGSDAYHLENYRNLDHTMREYHEILKLWADAGITPDKHNTFYCGTGWRASEAFFYAWLMGWPRVSVFDGGWFEWSNDENNPIETGIPS